MDIVKTVADAIDQIPGDPSSAEVARVAIEEYQKALWTPYFDFADRPMFVTEHRRNWANALTAHIMNVVGKRLCEHGENHGARDVSRELFEMIYESGAYIVTDADRTEAGLPARGPYGLTREEMRIMEMKRIEAMTRPMPPVILTSGLAPRTP